jgi:hypothetical protein
VALRTAGDVATPEALEELYRARFRAFLRVAASIAGERHAADAVHNGFVRARLPATDANRALLSLTAQHPDATVTRDDDRFGFTR